MMLSTRWAQLTWAILFAVMVSSSVAQTPDERSLDDPNDPARQEVVQLLMQALQDADPQNSDAKAMSKAIEFIQRAHRYRSGHDYWNDVTAHWNREDSRFANAVAVHSYLADQLKPSPYWIGVQSEAAKQYLLNVRDNYKVTGQGGLLVTTVTQDSPAEEAGLKVDDIILQFDSVTTDELGHLIAAIKSNEGSPAKLLLVRDGDILTLDITPRLRDPQPEENAKSRQVELADAWVEIYGNVLAEGVEATVHFNRNGVKEIHFHQGDETAGAKANELEKLPMVYRGFAKSLVDNLDQKLKTNDGGYYLEYAPSQYHWDTRLANESLRKYWEYSQPKNDTSVDGRLERLEKQLQELTNAIHELKKD